MVTSSHKPIVTLSNNLCINNSKDTKNQIFEAKILSSSCDTLLRSLQQQRPRHMHHQNRSRRRQSATERDDDSVVLTATKSARRWRSAVGSWWRRRSRASRLVHPSAYQRTSSVIVQGGPSGCTLPFVDIQIKRELPSQYTPSTKMQLSI